MKTLSAILLLSIIVTASAATYKGSQSVKVGKKTYKCTFNIAYSTSPPTCRKKTVKCKPTLKKSTKFSPILSDDATITVSVAKNKVTACKVEAKATGLASTLPPPVVLPPIASSSGEDMNCSCVLPTTTSALGRSLDSGIQLQTREGSDWATARLAAPAVAGNGTYKWVFNQETSKWTRKYCKPSYVAPVLPGVSNLLPILVLAGLAGLVTALGGGALLNAIIAALGRSLEIEEMEEREREQTRIISIISDRQGLLGLFGQGGNGGGLLGNLGNNGGLLGNLGNNGGLLANLGGNNSPSPPPAPAPGPGGLLGSLLGGAGGNAPATGGLLGNLLGGAGGNAPAPAANGVGNLLGLLGGGDNGGVAGLLSGGSNGGIQEALMQAALNQILQNPESLQGVLTAAVESGMAEETVNNLISSGKLEELAQNLLENGAGQEIINNIMPEGGMEALQQNTQESLTSSLAAMLNGMEPGSLESLLQGVDMETMEMKMQCKCVRNLPPVVVG